jgi:hypothetical protein
MWACPSGDSRAASSSWTGCPSWRSCSRMCRGSGVPQHDRVEVQAERGELVFLAFAVGLVDPAAVAVTDLAGQPMPGLLDSQMPVLQRYAESSSVPTRSDGYARRSAARVTTRLGSCGTG